MAYGGAWTKSLEKSFPFFLFFGKFFISFLLYSGMCFILSRSGVPRYSQISYIWFLVSVPGRKGFLCNISAKMQPTLHISTEVVYWLALKRSYGALYHLVATYYVRTFAFTFLNNGLASPKSQILRSQFELTNKFLGFKSLWTIRAEWIYFKPRKSWYKKNL